MRKLLLAGWMLLPIGAFAYHEGPGQDRMALDRIDARMRAATEAFQKEQWASAIADYEEILKMLPADRSREARKVRLELNKARMQFSQLPVANADLEALVNELSGVAEQAASSGSQGRSAAEAEEDTKLLAEARRALAASNYYVTWLMRLEGKAREDWEPVVESARQTYRLLAEQAEARGDKAAVARNEADLEAAVRLARMDLKELQGLPLPSE